jgi:hypothetical protein
VAARPWFRPRRYGWGFTPVFRQGWVLTGACVVVVSVLGITVAESQPWIFWTVFGLAIATYLVIAHLTRGDRR